MPLAVALSLVGGMLTVQVWHVWALRRALARVRAREALVLAVHARVNRLEWALARLLSRQLRRMLRRACLVSPAR